MKSFHLFEAHYHDNVDYQTRCFKMFFRDLKDMLVGMKSKLYFKTFKLITTWDENFLKFMHSLVDGCITKIDEILVQLSINLNVKTASDDYVNIRDSLSATLVNVNCYQFSCRTQIQAFKFQVSGTSPGVFLNVTSNGKLLAFHRFEMMNYFHSQTFDAKGKHCGKIHPILIKVSFVNFIINICITLFI